MRIDAINDLAIKIEHETQHAVRSRVLRPEVDRELAIVEIEVSGFVIDVVGHGYFFASPAFSSPGMTACMPSQGERKSKLRYS